ncbi:unnamed protein product [Oppiella nova]|uniref:Arginyl tRNA synthetase N-terminal domain-containing protein n=1 Tax=Oppiella nova TaxID=334625 RepID=A0A7R9Q9N7_9ACAR|nr:unnamed protein product [Oppiella nova]CAG2160601.1 unnamed protein product [Oppiella nova]
MVGLGEAKVPEVDQQGVVDVSKATLEKLEQMKINMPTGQWVYIENDLQGIYTLQNKSSDGNVLYLRLNCKIPSQKSGFAIEDKDGKELLKAHDAQTVQSLQAEGTLPSDWKNTSVLTRTKDRSHGDFASNIAMMGAKVAGMKPRDLAEKILANLPEVVDIAKAEIAGPGFINFFLNADQRFTVLDQIQAQKEQFGKTQANAAKKIQVEFVSANPTSSLHVGHGRGAAYEDVQYAEELDADGNKVVVSGDKEKHIDGLIHNSQALVGEGYRVFHQAALHAILDDIKDDLGMLVVILIVLSFGVALMLWKPWAPVQPKNEITLPLFLNKLFLKAEINNNL